MEPGNSVEEALKAVDQGLGNLKTSPHVHELQHESGLDSNGEAAAFITVVLDDAQDGQPYPWTRLKPIHDLIWHVFTERAVDRKPYIDFRLVSEVGVAVDDDVDEGSSP